MMTITYPIAVAAGLDAGNRSAKQAKRNAWSEEDYNVAATVTAKLLGHDPVRGGAA